MWTTCSGDKCLCTVYCQQQDCVNTWTHLHHADHIFNPFPVPSHTCTLTHTHTHTHTSLLTHVHTYTCTHAAAPDGSGSHNVSSVRTGSDAVWACPTTGSPSYGRGSPGSAIKDQSTTHRMPHHEHSTSSSSTQPNHSFQQARNQFEEEVAGSLDQALKQLFSWLMTNFIDVS